MEKSTNYLERMMEEQAELCTRIKKIEAAIDNPEKFNLDSTQVDLMIAQMSAMATYMNILQMRIEDEMILLDSEEKKDGCCSDCNACPYDNDGEAEGDEDEDEEDDDDGDEDDDEEYIDVNLDTLISIGNALSEEFDKITTILAKRFKKNGKLTDEDDKLIKKGARIQGYLGTISRLIEEHVAQDDEEDDEGSDEPKIHSFNVELPDDCPLKPVFEEMAKDGDSFSVSM